MHFFTKSASKKITKVGCQCLVYTMDTHPRIRTRVLQTDLKEIYYKPENMWKGYAAIDKLAEAANTSKQEARQWLEKQTIWQIYLPAPKYIPRRKITTPNSTPNETHQMDLLFMPADKVGRRTFKYVLSVVDVASRYKEAEPLTSKYSNEVAKAIEKIYARSKLTWPKFVQVDSGREFMGEFTDLMRKHSVEIIRVKPEPGAHRRQAIVERFNRTLAEKLFTPQYAKEILALARNEEGQSELSEYRNTEWVRNLKPIVATLNSTVTRLINSTPNDAIAQTKVHAEASLPVKQKASAEPDMPDLVRYLLEPGELENDTRRRATDPIWIIDTYFVSSAFKPADQWIYRLTNSKTDKELARSFVREELLAIDIETEVQSTKN